MERNIRNEMSADMPYLSPGANDYIRRNTRLMLDKEYKRLEQGAQWSTELQELIRLFNIAS